jgi:hypothetical protein
MAEKTDNLTRSGTGHDVEVRKIETTSPTIEDLDRTERAEVEHLRAEIAKDRMETEATLDAIQDRLTPAHLKEQAREKVREVTIGKAQNMAHTAGNRAKDAGYSMLDTLKDNIIPTAMIGVGLAWLVKNRKSEDEGHYGEYYADDPYLEEEYPEDQLRYYTGPAADMRTYYSESRESGQGRTARHAREKASGAAERAREKARAAGEKSGEMMDHAREKVSSVGERAGEAVGEARDRASEAASHAAHRTRELSRRARYKSRRMKDENPLIMAGALFAVGAALGFLIPETRKEQEWMGETRDELMDRAKERSRDTLERMEEVAKETGKTAKETAKEEAKRQGLASESDTKAQSAGGGSSRTATGTTGTETTPPAKSATHQPDKKREDVP